VSCRTGCPTQDHGSYAECLRGANLRIAYANSANGWDLTKQKTWDKELADYRSARAQGIEPAGCDRRSIDQAVQISDVIGQPFQG
jgi:hypothetical protein